VTVAELFDHLAAGQHQAGGEWMLVQPIDREPLETGEEVR
jgi:hypothetical protein